MIAHITILAFSEDGMYHKYLPTLPTPSPPCLSIQHRVSTYSFTLLSILTVLAIHTVIGFTLIGLNANSSHLDLEGRIEAMHLFRVTSTSRFILPLSNPLLFSLLVHLSWGCMFTRRINRNECDLLQGVVYPISNRMKVLIDCQDVFKPLRDVPLSRSQ